MCASWNPLFVPAESIETECTILNQDSPKIDRQSSKIKIPLKEHQKSLVYRCRELENSSTKKLNYNGMDIVTKFGIIGDTLKLVITMIWYQLNLIKCKPRHL